MPELNEILSECDVETDENLNKKQKVKLLMDQKQQIVHRLKYSRGDRAEFPQTQNALGHFQQPGILAPGGRPLGGRKC